MPNEVEIVITATDLTGPAFAGVLGKMAAMKAAARDLSHEMAGIGFGNFDISKMDASLMQLKSKLNSLGIADIADINIQPGRVLTQLQLLKRMINQAGIGDILDFNVNSSSLMQQLNRIGDMTETIPVRFDVGKLPVLGPVQSITERFNFILDPGVIQELNAARQAMDDFGLSLGHVTDTVPLANSEFIGFAQDTDRVKTSFDLFGGSMDLLNYKLGAFFGAMPSWSTVWRGMRMGLDDIGAGAVYAWSMLGPLGRSILNVASATNLALGGAGGGRGGGGLFALGGAAAGAGGGARGAAGGFGVFGGALAGTIGTVGVLHIAIDGIIEGLFAAVTATAAAGAGISAMTPAAQNLFANLTSTNDVSLALGQTLPPLTGKFNALAKAMAPQTIEAYGGAISILEGNQGAYNSVAKQTVSLFDTWIAKIDIWASQQKNFGQLLNSGLGFLSQFGHIFGEMGMALDNLLKADPGTAHFLFDVIGGMATLLNYASKLPKPLVETALAMHSFYLWGNLAGGLLAKLPGAYGSLGRIIVTVASNPALLALGTAAFEMARSWDTASPKIQSDIAAINASLSTMSASGAIIAIGQDMANLQKDLQGNTTGSILQQWKGLNTVFQESSDKLQAFGHELGQTVSGGFMHQLGALGDAIKMVFDPGYAAGQAAYVQLGHDVANVNTEIHNLVQGQDSLFKETGHLMQQGYSFTDSLALMDLAGVKTGDTFDIMKQKVDNLIKGYNNISITGGILENSINAINFASMQNLSDITRVTGGWDTFFKMLVGGESGLYTFAQDMALIATKTQAAQLASDGLAGSNLTSKQNFIAAAQAAQTELDNLYTLASAAGLGAKGTNMLSQAAKDMVAEMLPAAKNSSGLTTILYGLAQQGGYQGADSFKALSTWVGKTKNPMLDLDKITTTLTVDAGNLITDVRNLSVALGTTLNNAMATAIATAAPGGEQAFTKFADAVLSTHGAISNKLLPSAQQLANYLYTTMRGNVDSTKNTFYAFAQYGLQLSKDKVDQLWQDVSGHLVDSFAGGGTAADKFRNNNLGPLQGSLSKTVGGIQGLQYFIDQLHGKNVNVGVQASATGSLSYVEKALGINQSGSLLFRSAGGPVPGWGGGDIQPAMLEPGELVVDKYTTRNNAWLWRMLGIPGYSSGGVVGSKIPSMSNWVSDAEVGFTKQIESAFMNAAYSSLKKNVNSVANANLGYLANALGSSSARTGSIAVEENFAKSILWAYGWGPNQMNYLIPLWMKESGWNAYAVNPTSGAYGIPQALGHGHPYNLGDYQTQIRWGLGYISGRYGSPANAWGHEMAYNWYDDGGWLKPGPNYMWNGTGKPERLINASKFGGVGELTVRADAAGSTAFEQFMLQAIRNWVRVFGGGNVQDAFGTDQ